MITTLIGHLPFWQIYCLLYLGGVFFILVLSLTLFFPLYRWESTREPASRWKTILRWPSDETIRREFKWAFIGLASGIINPTLSIWLSARGYNKMYSRIDEYGYGYWALSWVLLFFFTEIFEYFWHRACHVYPALWKLHKLHHQFHNPSPVSVISNNPLDIFVQASPLLVVPLLFPIHDSTLFLTFALVNYAYGAYLHSGFDWPTDATSPHSRWFITNWV